jgi:hypothetical protein
VPPLVVLPVSGSPVDVPSVVLGEVVGAVLAVVDGEVVGSPVVPSLVVESLPVSSPGHPVSVTAAAPSER